MADLEARDGSEAAVKQNKPLGDEAMEAPSVNEEDSPLALASELGVEDQNVPATVDQFRTNTFDATQPRSKADRIVAYCTMLTMRHQRAINDTEKQAIFDILKSLWAIGPVSAKENLELNITGTLRSILGETPTPRAPYEYPEPLQRNAAIILERIESNIATETEEALERNNDSSTSPEPSAAPRVPKRKRTPVESSKPASLPTDDPTFKECMRGIMFTTVGRRTSRLDPDMQPPKRRSDVFGHNAISVGQWWPMRLCALRDGAHGHAQGGIHGRADAGAYSIVVSAQYDDLDIDNNDTILYSGSNSLENTDPENPLVTYATKSLRVSYTTQHPVRVLRSGSSNSQYAPSKGLRYDGLYRITREDVEQNKKGGAYLRFTLTRIEDQPEIVWNRPSTKERRVFDSLKDR